MVKIDFRQLLRDIMDGRHGFRFINNHHLHYVEHKKEWGYSPILGHPSIISRHMPLKVAERIVGVLNKWA